MTNLIIMKENIVQIKSYDFAIRIVKLYKYLIEEKREFVLSKQVLRRGIFKEALVQSKKQ